MGRMLFPSTSDVSAPPWGLFPRRCREHGVMHSAEFLPQFPLTLLWQAACVSMAQQAGTQHCYSFPFNQGQHLVSPSPLM